MADGMDRVLTIMVVIFVGSILLPIAFDSWFNASTGSWDDGAAQLWPVIPVIALLGIFYGLYNKYV